MRVERYASWFLSSSRCLPPVCRRVARVSARSSLAVQSHATASIPRTFPQPRSIMSAAAAAAPSEEQLIAAREAAKLAERRQADVVKELKSAANKDDNAIKEAVAQLIKFKKELEAASLAVSDFHKKNAWPVDQFNSLMTGRFFYVPSYEIYGGVAGLFDLGPPGAAIKQNILQHWRHHFVLYENMLELDCTTIAPKPVFDASGHVAKFCDLMCRDVKTNQYLRADHVLEDFVEKQLEDAAVSAELKEELKIVVAQADAFDEDELYAVYQKYKVLSPEGNELTKPEPFNLMFGTQIGPSGKEPGFFRPETAQGMFVNFKRLLEYNGSRLPFAAAQFGSAYRNEIGPRNGLIRTREFSMAEVEHFVNPADKSHTKFADVADVILTLYPRDAQLGTQKTIQMSVKDAVSQKIIDNETLAYFMARTQSFLHAIGVKPDRLRFRQHLANEMAHYACDCWDAEIEMYTRGWTECVGIADRSAYDLNAHSKATGANLEAFIRFPDGEREVEVVELKADKGKLGKQYKQSAKVLLAHLEALDTQGCEKLQAAVAGGSTTITIDGESFEVDKESLVFTKKTKRVAGHSIVPGVIEPSFGIGRILTAVLQHSYYIREGDDEARHVLALPAIVAPVKCSVLPLMSKAELLVKLPLVAGKLAAAGVSHKVDDTSVAIGRRYARTDEIGIPFAITVDYDTLPEAANNSVTLRERDSTKQIRLSLDEAVEAVREMSYGRKTWAEVAKLYPAVEAKSE